MDIVDLYDSLKHDLVLKAVDDAMDVCHGEDSDEYWDANFRDWLKRLLKLSLHLAVIKYEGNWYIAENGVPTAGIPSVDCGNIAVYFVLKTLVYRPEVRPVEFKYFIRFVDDGLGLWYGTAEQFNEWLLILKQSSRAVYGLDFTCEVRPINEMISFLDIQFLFDNGVLLTDLFRKPTDANRCLEYSSYHPRHTFRSIIYSQGIRNRRIINSNETLVKRLDELKGYFINSSHPANVVTKILDDIKSKPRILQYNRSSTSEHMTPWIVTYGPRSDEARAEAKKVNRVLKQTETWRVETEDMIPYIKVINRRAPNLKDLLFKRKSIALSNDIVSVNCTYLVRILMHVKGVLNPNAVEW